MAALIDSSVLIAAERGTLDIARLDGHQGDVAVSVITASELLHSVHRAESDLRRARREAWVEALISRIPVLPFDLRAARMHARLGARAAASGTPLGAHDLIIAATALARDLAVITRDLRSFPQIEELEVLHW